jgi:endonuclease YncB( thermonuclease family)
LNKQNQETEEERHRGGTYCATKTKAKTRNVNKHFWIDVAERKRDTIQATLARVKRKKRKFNLSTFFCETKAVQKI